jgi:sensor domain CHASE-containing protein
MGTRTNWLTAILAIALLASIIASGTLLSSSTQLDADRTKQAKQLQLNAMLFEAQSEVQSKIDRLAAAMKDLGKDLSSIGLSGVQARSQFNVTIDQDRYITDIITFGTDGVVLEAEPAIYRNVIGVDLGGAANVQKILTTKMPVFSGVIRTVEGDLGAIMAVPVFNDGGQFLGAVSAMFNASEMIGDTVDRIANGPSYNSWCMQLDGMLVYETDRSQIGRNLIYGPDYIPYPLLQAVGWRMLNESTGHGTYSFISSSQQMINKQCYWASVGVEGTYWRLAMVERV